MAALRAGPILALAILYGVSHTQVRGGSGVGGGRIGCAIVVQWYCNIVGNAGRGEGVNQNTYIPPYDEQTCSERRFVVVVAGTCLAQVRL